ncbi:MAG: PAS domain-containing sensor histidine kinase [Sphingobacteriales bacterium SCN 48-20]|uniref:HAMP domain-containing sensor histidine kinase n=1 Tax=Terrimonas ferruginea TaxID=249 RepID=UPI00086BF947|nr:ATP-binding protein [Terrimonas ferruginea]MBN8784708.1 HAMP domain-containing protein [Terrimonas ferruginea]ODT93902.1 MAG: PAS domain-containing sensor histidine kinase [Sphingobacteriales bacterium SCN 48-20]OJW45539.1 MAG: PAS domain-containing sensor histidine kinase [Sphingobacteriales bacterium 48-107]
MTTVKKRIRLGTLFLFLLTLLSCGVGIFHLVRLKNDATLILKNNYESLDYTYSLQQIMDTSGEGKILPAAFDSVLKKQEQNITEPGEQEATRRVRAAYEKYKLDTGKAGLTEIRAALHTVLRLNMSAIETKNIKAGNTANTALTYITLLAAIIFLIGFTFSFNFPGVLTTPISTLTEGLREIARKNYHFRIHLDRKDEFGQMAESFNDMAERLEYFENSNLNKLIFEKTRAEAVINSLKEASIGIDKNDVILFANDQALQLLGMQTTDVVGKSVEQVSSRNDLFRFLLEDRGTLPFKIVLDNRENYFTKEIIEISQQDANSKVIILRNITSFKELDVAKTNFIATISHELKTPLASSDFSLKLLSDERVSTLTEEQRELINNLKQDNQRMLRILSELLNMSQVEAGKIQLDIAETDPVSIIENAVLSVNIAAREKQVVIERVFEKDLPPVKADAEKTTWVLNNFLMNAIKYSSEEQKVILRIYRKEGNVVFSVTDQGPGIPAEYQEKVFDRFFKVPGSKAGGTGLGLAISREFIEAQGGQIWVESEYGKGSCFGFSLPLAGGK